MKYYILHIFVILAVVSRVISDDDSGIIVNGKNNTDVPSPSTVPNTSSSTEIPTTTITPPSTTTPTTTTPNATTPNTTTPNTTTTTTTTVQPTTTNATTTTSPTSTESPSTNSPSTTQATTVAPSRKDRKFDGASFVGGIILAVGLMAICFVSWKFYKARTERNYHTL